MTQKKELWIVQPYHPSNVKFFRRVYMNPLTLPYLAGLVPSDKWNVSLKDENIKKLDFDPPKKPDLVLVTSLAAASKRANEIGDLCRKNGILVALGGIHATSMWKDGLTWELQKHFDSVAVGEAENILSEILEDAYRGFLKPLYIPQKETEPSQIVVPRRDLVDSKFYHNVPKCEVSRGCPYSCDFCAANLVQGAVVEEDKIKRVRKIKYREPEDVVSELLSMFPKTPFVSYLKSKGLFLRKLLGLKHNFVFFTDNNICGNPQKAKELFKAMINEGLNIKWISQADLKMAHDPELLKLVKESGCVGMLIGFESLDSDNLKDYSRGKTFGEETFQKDINAIHEAGISIIGCFIFGLDKDTPETFEKTRQFIEKTEIEVPQLTLLTPFPGTLLRKKLKEKEKILHSNFQDYDATHVCIWPLKMSPRTLRKLYDGICSQLYKGGKIWKRVAKAFLRYRSLYKAAVVWQLNKVYKKLWQVSREDYKKLPPYIKI